MQSWEAVNGVERLGSLLTNKNTEKEAPRKPESMGKEKRAEEVSNFVAHFSIGLSF